MNRRIVFAGASLLLAACLTTMNRPKVTLRAGTPALEPRAPGCHVEVIADGQPVTRPHLDIADVVLEWPRDKIQEQGPEAAMETLRQSACENGAFIMHHLRALTTGTVDGGFVYEATFATLLGEDGEPLNRKAQAPAPRPGQLVDDAAAEVENARRDVAPSGGGR